MNINLTEIITALGLGGLGIAAITYLAQQLITSLLNKDLETFKTNLQRAADQANHAQELEVQKKFYEFSSLRTRQAELVATIYAEVEQLNEVLGDVVRAFEVRQVSEGFGKAHGAVTMSPVRGFSTLTPEERIICVEAGNRASAVLQAFRPHKIWFTAATEEAVESVTNECILFLNRYIQGKFAGAASEQENDSDVPVTFEDARERVGTALQALRGDFRAITGAAN